MRSLIKLLLVICVMALSATGVVAQNEIVYADDTKPQIPRDLIGEYLENGVVDLLGEKEIIGYGNFIFSVQTTQTKEVWKKSDNGVVYVQSSLLGQEVAWWMMLATISIFSMIIAQISKNEIAALIAALIALIAGFVAGFVAFAALAAFVAFFTALVVGFVAFAAAFVAFAAAFAVAVAVGGNKTPYIIYYVGMIVCIVAMYFAF